MDLVKFNENFLNHGKVIIWKEYIPIYEIINFLISGGTQYEEGLKALGKMDRVKQVKTAPTKFFFSV